MLSDNLENNNIEKLVNEKNNVGCSKMQVFFLTAKLNKLNQLLKITPKNFNIKRKIQKLVKKRNIHLKFN
jgi:ribosomal protein S15P/S13E